MKKGDQCFFYHSNIGKEIVGIVEVIKEAYLDKTDQSGRFVAVTVKFIRKPERPITLENIKKIKELSHLSLIKQSRLSVMPIDAKSWKILNNMGKNLDNINLCQKKKRKNQKIKKKKSSKKEGRRFKENLRKKENL